MASTEMPGAPIKPTTSSKQQKDLANGRRMLEAYRSKRKKSEEKNKTNAIVKPTLRDTVADGIAANGSGSIGEDPSKQNYVGSHSSNPIANGSNKQPTWEPGGDKGAASSTWSERSNGSDWQEATISVETGRPVPPMAMAVSTLLEGGSSIQSVGEKSGSRVQSARSSVDSAASENQAGIARDAQLAETEPGQIKSTITQAFGIDRPHFSQSQIVQDSKQERSTDGPWTSKVLDKGWIRPARASSGLLTGSLHGSSMTPPTSRQETAITLASALGDEKAVNYQQEPAMQFRPSVTANGPKVRDPKESLFSFSQPKRITFADVGEREPVVSSKPFDKLSFQQHTSSSTPSLKTLPSPFDVKGSVSSDHDKGVKLLDQLEERQRQSEKEQFAALEQHIDELTQEKFALQRALDGARSLSESLSQQNSALTEDFNSQGGIINQLQAEVEKKKEEISAQSLVLSRLMMERERAQQENNSAMERSQMLAGEVIALEEKVLKLRSSELKLERELKTLNAENDSYRAQVAALEKDRQNIRSMLEALQEDKKLLNNQLQKALVSVSPAKEVPRRDSKDASTCTEDLGVPMEKGQITVERHLESGHKPSSSTTSISVHHAIGFRSPPPVATLSADEMRTVKNIDVLISELFVEKTALLELLKTESSKASELQVLNQELSKKLEMQTQRLELVVAQNMAHEGSGVIMNPHEAEQQESDYVDEGDEVVERVLGWIMRLFPGGSSRSKRM